MRLWRDGLRRMIGSGAAIPVAAKAQMLGVPVPGRRQLLKIGGATILGASVLAACGNEGGAIAETGTTEAGETTTTVGSTTTTIAEEATDTDLVLLRTASSLETLAVNAYDAASATGLVTTTAIADTAKLFRDQHDEHAAELQAATADAGGQPYTDANPFLKANVVDPALAHIATEADVVTLALSLETLAAETYVYAAGVLSTPELRQAIMAIGGVEARHMAVLRAVLTQPPVPDAFLKFDQRAPDSALLTS